ncbi:unnamed protein product [Paramecium pentaurelia]|uniref:FYVE-type domain-containing protein n=1 Tax=Paramecium pentaurelia TaxID=43138 RepID=A0A8S1TQC1_9CILI|nr:unnamed protein product [Paramecium pentaurelia]
MKQFITFINIPEVRGKIPKCQICQKSFSFTTREHQCKRCLRAVCEGCSPFKINHIKKDGKESTKPHRMCKICKEESEQIKNFVEQNHIAYGVDTLSKQWLGGTLSQQDYKNARESAKIRFDKTEISGFDNINYSLKEFYYLVGKDNQKLQNVCLTFCSKNPEVQFSAELVCLANFLLCFSSEASTYQLLTIIYKQKPLDECIVSILTYCVKGYGLGEDEKQLLKQFLQSRLKRYLITYSINLFNFDTTLFLITQLIKKYDSFIKGLSAIFILASTQLKNTNHEDLELWILRNVRRKDAENKLNSMQMPTPKQEIESRDTSQSVRSIAFSMIEQQDQSQNNELKAEISNLKLQLALKDNEIESYKFQLQQMQSPDDSKKDKYIQQKNDEIAILLARVDALTLENKQLSKKESSYLNQNSLQAEQQKIIQEQQQQIERLKTKLKDTTFENRAMSMSLATSAQSIMSGKEVQDLKQQHENEKQQLFDQIHTLEQNKAQLQRIIDSQKQLNQRVVDYISSMTINTNVIELSIKPPLERSTKNDNEDYKFLIDTKNQQNQILKQLLMANQQQIQELNKGINQSNCQFSEIQILQVILCLYRVVYLILKTWSDYRWLTILLCLIQYLQYTYLNFGLKVQYVWQNKAYSDLINLLIKYFTITISVKNIGIQNYLSVFYICFGLIVLSILLIMLLAFVIKNQKLQKPPLLLLKFILKIILTIGFWPIVRMQFGLLACEYNKQGIYVMMFEQSQECWTSEYYIHAVVAIIGLIVTLLFSVLMAFITYESRNTNQDASAMRNGRSYSILLVYIFVQIMVYQLLPTPEYTIIIIFVFLIGSSYIFISTHLEQPYYDNVIQKIWSISSAVNLWTIIMMFYSYKFDGQTFQKTVQAWLIGIPLIIGILAFRQQKTVDLFVANLKKFKNGMQIILLCEYLVFLMKRSEKCQRSQLLLDSYIELHKEICDRPDCSVKQKIELANKFKENPIYTDRNHIIIELIIQIYHEGIKKFPDDTPLRLSYIYFLFNQQRSYSIIMIELNQAMDFKPTLDYEFHIFRYKTIIEEESEKNAELFDTANQLNQTKEFIEYLEIVTLKVVEFWSALSEEVPDMSKLMVYGFKIIKLQEEIDYKWNKLQDNKSLKLYNYLSRFYQLVLDDQEQADNYQQLYWTLQKTKQQELSELEEICNQSTPTLVASAQFQKVNIYAVNKSFCSLLGFSKADLIDRSINQIIPNIFIEKHDQCLELFIENKARYSKDFITQSVYLLTKSNYILPIFSTVKLLQAQNNQLFFIAQYQQSFSPKQLCYLLLDIKGYIEHISSSCISYLRLDIQRIKMRKINIKELFPDFHQRKDEFLSKSGAKLYIKSHGMKYSTKTVDTTLSCYDQIEFQCYLSYIQFPCLKDSNKYGMAIKLEQLKINNVESPCMNLLPIQQKRTKFPVFQYIPPTVYYMDYLSLTQIEESINNSHVEENASKISKIADYFLMAKKMTQSIKHVLNYEDGIKTKRLWDNQIIDIQDNNNEDSEEIEEDDNEQMKKSQKQEKEIEIQEFQHYFKLFQSKSSIKKLLINSHISKTLKLTNLFIQISLFILYTSGLIVFTFNLNDDTKVSSMIFNLSLTNKRLSSCLMINAVLQDLKLIRFGEISNMRMDLDEFFTYNLKLLDQEIDELISIHSQLSIIDTYINEEYQIYETIYFTQNVKLFSSDGTSQNYTYKEAIDQLIAKAIQLNQNQISLFDDSNVDYFYYNYNILNSIIQSYQIPLNYLYYSIKSVAENSLDNKIAFLILQTFIQFITYLLIAIYLIHFSRQLQQIYLFYFEINEQNIQKVIQNCEKFLSILNVGDDEVDEEYDENLQHHNHEKEEIKMLNKKTKKVWKNSNAKFKKLMITAFFIFLNLQVYFVYQYYSAQQVVEDTYYLCPILNTTSLLESQYRLGDNAIREYILNPNQNIFSTSPQTFIQSYLVKLQDVNAEMQTKFTQNVDLFQQDFINVFQQLYIQNPCPLLGQLQNFINEDYCNTILDGTVSEGLSIGLTKFYENLRILLIDYELQRQQNQTEIQNQYYGILLLSTNFSLEIRVMQKIIIRYTQRYLIEKLEKSISDSFNNLSITRGTLFICFTFYIFIISFFLWIPSNTSLIKSMQKSRTLLLLMPMQILTNSTPIRRYLRAVLKN